MHFQVGDDPTAAAQVMAVGLADPAGSSGRDGRPERSDGRLTRRRSQQLSP
jgi:hypothetical protein